MVYVSSEKHDKSLVIGNSFIFVGRVKSLLNRYNYTDDKISESLKRFQNYQDGYNCTSRVAVFRKLSELFWFDFLLQNIRLIK